jgi:hypothetical protein
MLMPNMRHHVMGKALGIEGGVGQKVEPLALHLPATAARDPPYLQFKENPRVATRQVAHSALRRVLPEWIAGDSTLTALIPYPQGLLPSVRAFIEHLAGEFPKSVLI